ncbi:trans-sulfuration enzyme family protein [Rhodococcus opacus]|uniref:homocysteine desulfhydrase n=1 Tax=Rhodococcus opacus (strain B4) TaxID=632772 RepID=C1B658_RHOOB|nr:aminotransferase class I/II-fold pyridoxal phosphate-dependent enzyme [Rhodococcus opacus]BAH55469.1 putative amino acid lyase [Rhodococcus opacus B4]
MTSSRSARLETIAVHGGMDGLIEAGLHVPSIDFSTTNPLSDIEGGGDSYEHLTGGGAPREGQSSVYQRLWNPGIARFEESLAALEGTDGAVSFSSGMAALAAAIIATVSAGKPHIIGLRPAYGGTDHLLSTGLLGSKVTWTDIDGVAAAITSETGLIVAESPANPTLELIDISALVAAARDIPILVDNTFATPVLQRPADHGAAMVLHSATKYLGGHGDVMGGVIAATEEWVARLRQVRVITGALLHPMAGYLLHRGLRTLPVRIYAQQATAREIASRVVEHPALAKVIYPGLPGQDPMGLLGRQMDGPGAIVAFELAGGYEAAAAFTHACKLLTHAVSLGGVDTLVQHPASLTHRPVEPSARPGAGVVRISVGLEHVEDLLADITQALDAAKGVVTKSMTGTDLLSV